MPMSMIGGGMIPLFVMPPWLVSLSAISPVKWAILALEGATWRGFGAGDMLLPCLVLIAVGLTAFLVGTRGRQNDLGFGLWALGFGSWKLAVGS